MCLCAETGTSEAAFFKKTTGTIIVAYALPHTVTVIQEKQSLRYMIS